MLRAECLGAGSPILAVVYKVDHAMTTFEAIFSLVFGAAAAVCVLKRIYWSWTHYRRLVPARFMVRKGIGLSLWNLAFALGVYMAVFDVDAKYSRPFRFTMVVVGLTVFSIVIYDEMVFLRINGGSSVAPSIAEEDGETR